MNIITNSNLVHSDCNTDSKSKVFTLLSRLGGTAILGSICEERKCSGKNHTYHNNTIMHNYSSDD